MSRQRMLGSFGVAAAALLLVATAHGGVYRDLYRGLELIATPSGGPLLGGGDGSRVNGQRLGRLRIVPNELGKGYRLELDRTFGVDSRGRAEVFDTGLFELELSGPTQTTLSYTSRSLGKKRFYTVNGESLANNLNYRAAAKTGAVDASIVGTLSYDNTFEVNQLGFYTLAIDITNANSRLIFEDLGETRSEPLNFDVGPINVRGNVFLDLLIAGLSTVGVDTSGLQQAFGKSPVDQINAALQEALTRSGAVAGYQLTLDPGGATLVDPLDEIFEEVQASRTSSDTVSTMVIPEPASALLLVIGGLLLRRR